MKEFFQKSGGLLLLISFLLSVLIGVLSIIIKGSTDPVTNAMATVTAPVRSAVSSVAEFGENTYEFLREHEELKMKLAEMEVELADLERTVRESEEALRENEQLRELLTLQAKRRDFVFESAKVTTRSFTGWESLLTLNKGAKAGVEMGDAVVTEAGHLVGVVSELGDNWCIVSTIISTDISIGGVVARTGTDGVLEGEFSLMTQNQLRLAYLSEDALLVAGDQVLTSGLGELYPQGLTVGKIQGVFDENSGISRYAVVVPEVDLSSLIEVFIIKDFEIIE